MAEAATARVIYEDFPSLALRTCEGRRDDGLSCDDESRREAVAAPNSQLIQKDFPGLPLRMLDCEEEQINNVQEDLPFEVVLDSGAGWKFG